MPSRLKSLELQGYKTFASRTEFVFAEMVTAIVGPNGSGKSNIADSLRWVLGEQSYSLLRAKKTEDMIFSGSEQRSRAGMASATITFDNSDGWLPIDFSEVAITRRAYRDGQNEYLLNGQRVRLRDVSELLAKSGLAERTYTIIGQGLVDAALALKAEERRRLFEEAAGIGLYRARREESLKRLEATRRNLERVQDILAELQPRLRSLERQARRAVEYEQVTADLRLLLREFYGYHWHHAQQELTEARSAAAVQEESLEQIRQAQLGHDQKLFNLREALQSLREDLSALHRQSAALHTQREGLSRELAVAEERSRSLEAQRSLGQQEIARLENEAALDLERLETAGRELAGLQAELEEATQQVENAQHVLQTRQLERRKVEGELAEARQKLSGFTARQAHLEARQVEGQAQLERRRIALQEAIQAGELAQVEQRQLSEKASSLQNVLHDCENARRAVETELEAGRQQVLAIEQTRRKAQEILGQRQAQAAGLRARLEVLDQAEASLTGYASGARVLLEAIRGTRLQGTPQALSGFLEVPENLETAIAAALGEFLDAVLLEGEANLDAALEILSKASARGALLPLDQLRAERPLSVDLSQAPGGAQAVLGVAASLISASPAVAPVVQLLLGHVLVVRDRQSARQVLSSLGKRADALPINLRVVTLKGEVFHLSGAILAGQEENPATLSRPRQRRELEADIEMVSEQIEMLEGQVEAFHLQTDRMAEDERALKLELKARQEAEKQADEGTKAAEVALEKASRNLQWQIGQRSQLEADINQRLAQTESITTELDQLELDVAQARENLRLRTQALADLSLDELQTGLSHWNTRAAVAERACEEARKRQQERTTALERARQILAEQQDRLGEIQRELLVLEETRRQYRQEEAQLNQQIELLQTQIEPAESELDQLDQEQRIFQVTDSEGRQALAQAEHRHAQARINLARRQESLDSLRRRIEDDFGLVAFEYDEAVSGPTPLPLSGMVESLPFVAEVSPELEESIRRQRAQLRRMGPVNPEAQVEFQEVSERFKFLSDQVSDLNKAEEDIKEVIAELDLLMEREFRKTFDAVAQEFRQIFTRLFGGGSARLVLTDPEDMTDTGIDIEARLPGRREQGLSLLSGGERSLTAAALVFSLLRVSPTPFCVLDEVDAMLDEANVGRFRELLRELSQNTQFVVVTHNRNTVQAADVIYGVTMGHDSASQVVSLKLDEVSQAVV